MNILKLNICVLVEFDKRSRQQNKIKLITFVRLSDFCVEPVPGSEKCEKVSFYVSVIDLNLYASIA
jgi:hypothetical protein